jgi:hypothetical protein
MANELSVEYMMTMLKQKVKVAREAKSLGQKDLFDYSIRSAEKLITELLERVQVGTYV